MRRTFRYATRHPDIRVVLRSDYTYVYVCSIVDDDVHICTCLVDVAVGGIAGFFHGNVNLGMHPSGRGDAFRLLCAGKKKIRKSRRPRRCHRCVGSRKPSITLGTYWYVLLVFFSVPGER